MNEENVEIMENDKNEIDEYRPEEVSSSGNEVIYFIAAGAAVVIGAIATGITLLVRKRKAKKAAADDTAEEMPKEHEHTIFGYKIVKVPKETKISEEE